MTKQQNEFSERWSDPHQWGSLPSPALDRVYWVVPGQLLAGAYPGQKSEAEHRQRLSGLFDLGMRTIISLMEEDERDPDGDLFRPYQAEFEQLGREADQRVCCLRFPIVDQDIPTMALVEEALAAIDQSMQQGQPVYVHCFGGIGRTGTIIACWLLRQRHATQATVLSLLQRLRQADKARAHRPSPENSRQVAFVQAYAQAYAQSLESGK